MTWTRQIWLIWMLSLREAWIRLLPDDSPK